ncbi:hypothetical protein AGMMS50239_27680 [Bacteroidia bacterium]|nr:hypothetical protein AGMMS50239_27680 [Bacteroidia bacterium]
MFVDSTTFNNEDLEIIKLEGTIMPFDDLIMHPVAIDIKESLLLLKNRSTDYIYDIFDLDNNNKKINECFMFGQGPNDFIYPMVVPSNDTNIWIYDQPNANLREYTLHSITTEKFPRVVKNLRFEGAVLGKAAIIQNNNVLVSTNFNPAIRFRLYNDKGEIEDSIGKYPELTTSNMSEIEKIMNLKNDFTTNFKDRIFICYYYTDFIEVYDYQGNVIKRMHGPDQVEPVLEQKNAGGGFVGASSVRDRTYKCYSSPVQAGKEVFALYFGELYQDYQEKDSKILVFDWDGNPLRMYELNIPIFTFTVDEENKIIYGITNSPEYRIIKFCY